eukprot:1379696-Amorphochlora_amoeboformis.AAC.1
MDAGKPVKLLSEASNDNNPGISGTYYLGDFTQIDINWATAGQKDGQRTTEGHLEKPQMKKARKENDGFGHIFEISNLLPRPSLVSRMIKAGPKRGVRLWESKAREDPRNFYAITPLTLNNSFLFRSSRGEDRASTSTEAAREGHEGRFLMNYV